MPLQAPIFRGPIPLSRSGPRVEVRTRETLPWGTGRVLSGCGLGLSREGVWTVFVGAVVTGEKSRLDQGPDRADDRDKAENLDLLRIISRICLEKEMWRCQFAALERRYELDAALRGDTLFYYQVVGVAQNLGDEDGVLRWTTEGISAVGQRLDLEGKTSRREQSPLRALWMAQAGALTAAGDRDSAVAVYLHVARGDPTDVRPILAAAETLNRGMALSGWSSSGTQVPASRDAR